MRLNVYSIFDTASGLYGRPFFAQADGESLRSFQDLTANKEHPVGQHPEDYSLHRLGTYDDTTGKLVAEDTECLITGLECVAKLKNFEAQK